MTLAQYRVSYWTGPTQVAQVADRLRKHDATGVEEGTERVYFRVSATDGPAARYLADQTLQAIGMPRTGIRDSLAYLG
jgi:hypothetical protein